MKKLFVITLCLISIYNLNAQKSNFEYQLEDNSKQFISKRKIERITVSTYYLRDGQMRKFRIHSVEKFDTSGNCFYAKKFTNPKTKNFTLEEWKYDEQERLIQYKNNANYSTFLNDIYYKNYNVVYQDSFAKVTYNMKHRRYETEHNDLYIIDSTNTILAKIKSPSDTLRFFYNENGHYSHNNRRGGYSWKAVFDDDGNQVKFYILEDIYHLYHRDSNGNLLIDELYKDEKLYFWSVHTYNEKGQEITAKYFGANNTFWNNIRYEYEDNGLIKRIINYKENGKIDYVEAYDYLFYE